VRTFGWRVRHLWRRLWSRSGFTSADGWTWETTQVHGRPVRSAKLGRLEQAPEVVFVPGLGAPGYLVPWALQIAEWTRVSVLDLPGWRWGRATSCPPTLDGIAEAIAGWLASTERRHVILIGHSTGAQVALHAARIAPERLAGVVLVGPTFDPAARNPIALLRRTFHTLTHEVLEEVPAALPSYLHSGGWGLLRMLASSVPDRAEDLMRLLKIPVLILTGVDDAYAPPAWAQRLAELASARCIVLPGGHNGFFPYPHQADAALQLFVAELTR
jgi:pimeloyl-ACP methyl ester carboxylesterase